MHEFFNFPLDGFYVKVRRTIPCCTPEPLYLMQRKAKKVGNHSMGQGRECDMRSSAGVVLIADNIGSVLFNDGIGQAGQTLQAALGLTSHQLRATYAILVPDVIGPLFMRKEWSALFLLSRFCSPTWPWEEWPPPCWRQENSSKHSVKPSSSRIDAIATPQAFDRVCKHLKRWAPCILEAARRRGGECAVEEEFMLLETDVKTMKAFLEGFSTKPTTQGGCTATFEAEYISDHCSSLGGCATRSRLSRH